MRNFFKHITKIGLLTGSLFLMGNAYSQCANNNTFWQNAGTPAAGTTTTVTGTWGGEYITVGVVNGSVYTFSTCGGGAWDSQLTLYNNSGGAALGYNDDFCGLQSQITWTATFTGTLRVLLDRYNCSNQASPMTITITRNAAGGYNPCSSISTLSCGVSTSANNTAGNGAWNTYGGPFSVPGRERIFQFTPTITGVHSITVTSGSGYLDLFYKNASGCNSTGWTYVDDIIGTATNNVTLTAGTAYYIMLDDEDINATTASITIGCPSPVLYNPCASIGSLSCGVTTSVLNPAGNGAWSSFGGPFTTPGTEKLYTFTAPYTGPYSIAVNHSSAGYVDLFYKQSASGCNNSGWTYVDDILGSATNTVNLTGGVTYYIMLDDEDVSASSSTINITCPPPPCVGSTVDGSYTYSAPFVISGNTTGACDNSALRVSEDLTYAINIGCAGTYTFSLCGGASWDTYLFLTTAAGGGTQIASNDDACSLQSSVSAFLNPGTYYISVEGFSALANGPFTMNVSGAGSPPSIAYSTTNVSCFGGNNGSVTAFINGNGNSATATLNGAAFSGSATGLTAGSYTLVATNCWGSTTQIFPIGQPSALSASSSNTAILCNGGSSDVTVTAAGGTAPYSGTGNYTVGAGSYSYTVTDANGCSASTSVNVTQPLVLSASSSNTSILCNGGSSDVTVTAAGGTAPYSGIGNYSVGAGSYSYTVTDANGCSASTSVNISEPTALSASSSNTAILCNGGEATVSVTAAGGTAPYIGTGNYSVVAGSYSYTVTDANGCNASTSVNITEPSALSVSSSNTAILCNGGSSDVTVTAAGGTAPYTGTGNYTVGAGSYSYTVTDANGCNASTSVNISEPSVLSASSSNTAILCNGGSSDVTVTAAGGTAPYSGTGNYSVGAGSYSYTVTDANGCSASTSVNISEPSVLLASSSNTAILCNGGEATVSVTAAGGTAPYIGTGNYSVTAGAYSYTVTDANGCSAVTSGNVTEPSLLVMTLSNTDIACNGGTSTVSVTATGGVSPYFGTGNFTVSAGSYDYTVTDGNGCYTSSTINVTEPSVLGLTATADVYGCGYNVSCNGSSNGYVNLVATGGTSPYVIGGDSYNALTAGTYNYTVTDANGCTSNASATLTEPTALSMFLVISNYNGYGVSCNGSDNGSIVADVSGGCENYSYVWSNGANTAGITDLTAGNYTLQVFDANGCTVSAGASLTEPDALIVDAGDNALVYAAYPPMACTDLNATVTGGVATYTYTWSNGGNTSSINVCPSSNTTYIVTVTDQNGCSASDDVMVCSADITCNTNGGSGNEANNNALLHRANVRVAICHHTGHGDETFCLPISAIADHLAHGDVLGVCGASYSCDGMERTMEIEEPMEDFITMDVFPNPTASNTSFNIRIVSGSDKTGSVEMMDISGKVVRNFGMIDLVKGELHTIEVNNNNLNAGIYIIRLITDKGEVQSFRLVQN